MFDFDLDTEDMVELEEEIRAAAKITIRALEMFYEELKNSNLPENVKMDLLASKAKNQKNTQIR